MSNDWSKYLEQVRRQQREKRARMDQEAREFIERALAAHFATEPRATCPCCNGRGTLAIAPHPTGAE